MSPDALYIIWLLTCFVLFSSLTLEVTFGYKYALMWGFIIAFTILAITLGFLIHPYVHCPTKMVQVF